MTINSLHNFIFRNFLKQKQQEQKQIRDEKGRFIKGNKYRFRKTDVNVHGVPITVLAQDIHVGNFFRATRKTK